MIESPPALRTAGEIHASRQQRRLELGRSEHIAQEMAQYGLQARKLLWQQVSQRTPGLIRLSVDRSEEHTSELPSLMRNSYAVFCLKKTNKKQHAHSHHR